MNTSEGYLLLIILLSCQQQAEDAVETRKAFQALIKYAAALQNGETVIASHLTNAQECEVVFSQYLGGFVAQECLVGVC